MQALTTNTRISDPEAEKAQVCTTAGEVLLPASSAVTFLELPTPPSVNAMFRNVRRLKGKGTGRVETELYRDWKGHAGWRLREQRPQPVPGRVLIIINIERLSDFADIDNRVKATLDLLVKHQVIDDDRFVSGVAIAWAPPRNAAMRLAIMPAANLSLRFQLAQDGATGGWFFDAPQPEEEIL